MLRVISSTVLLMVLAWLHYFVPQGVDLIASPDWYEFLVAVVGFFFTFGMLFSTGAWFIHFIGGTDEVNTLTRVLASAATLAIGMCIVLFTGIETPAIIYLSDAAGLAEFIGASLYMVLLYHLGFGLRKLVLQRRWKKAFA